MSAAFSDEFANQFEGMGKKELEELAHSCHTNECVRRDDLNNILRELAL